MQLAYRIIGLTATLLMALGLGCALLGGVLAMRTLVFAGDSRHAVGTITDYREIRDGDEIRYAPVLRFKTETGEIVKVHGQVAPTFKRFAIGAEVPVIYRASAPLEARIALFVDNWLGPSIAFALAVASFLAGWLMRRQILRATQARDIS
jgi:hypothetical protein